MYQFADKKNQEDVISLRWPKACLSCGIDIPERVSPRHGIIGLFYVDKRPKRGDRRHTQVLVKLPGFFYMCEACKETIDRAAEDPPKNAKKLVDTLHESPWMQFIEIEKTGHVILPEGKFKNKLQETNPEAWLRSKACPMAELKQLMK